MDLFDTARALVLSRASAGGALSVDLVALP
jgi:hypothetical protein